ncbi:unnamed protein product [Scytosiphon promiscuus]
MKLTRPSKRQLRPIIKLWAKLKGIYLVWNILNAGGYGVQAAVAINISGDDGVVPQLDGAAETTKFRSSNETRVKFTIVEQLPFVVCYREDINKVAWVPSNIYRSFLRWLATEQILPWSLVSYHPK